MSVQFALFYLDNKTPQHQEHHHHHDEEHQNHEQHHEHEEQQQQNQQPHHEQHHEQQQQQNQQPHHEQQQSQHYHQHHKSHLELQLVIPRICPDSSSNDDATLPPFLPDCSLAFSVKKKKNENSFLLTKLTFAVRTAVDKNQMECWQRLVSKKLHFHFELLPTPTTTTLTSHEEVEEVEVEMVNVVEEVDTIERLAFDGAALIHTCCAALDTLDTPQAQAIVRHLTRSKHLTFALTHSTHCLAFASIHSTHCLTLAPRNISSNSQFEKHQAHFSVQFFNLVNPLLSISNQQQQQHDQSGETIQQQQQQCYNNTILEPSIPHAFDMCMLLYRGNMSLYSCIQKDNEIHPIPPNSLFTGSLSAFLSHWLSVQEKLLAPQQVKKKNSSALTFLQWPDIMDVSDNQQLKTVTLVFNSGEERIITVNNEWTLAYFYDRVQQCLLVNNEPAAAIALAIDSPRKMLPRDSQLLSAGFNLHRVRVYVKMDT